MNPLAATGFNMGVAGIGLLLYFFVGPTSSVSFLLAIMAVHILRSFLTVLEASVSQPEVDRDQLYLMAQMKPGEEAEESSSLFDFEYTADLSRLPVDEARQIHTQLASAHALAKVGSFQEAKKIYQGLESKIHEAQFEHNLGVLYWLSGEPERADQTLRKSWATRSGEGSWPTNGGSEEAILDYLEKRESQPRAFIQLAIYHLRAGRAQKSLDVLERCRQAHPESERELRLYLAWTEWLAGTPESAREHFEAGLAEEPSNPLLLVGSGLEQLAASDFRSARQTLTRAERLIRAAPPARHLRATQLGRVIAALVEGQAESAVEILTHVRPILGNDRPMDILAAAADPSQPFPDVSDTQELLDLYLAGRHAILAGTLSLAIDPLERAVAHPASGGREKKALGLAYLLADRAGKAQALLEEISEDEDGVLLLRALAQCATEPELGQQQLRNIETHPMALRCLARFLESQDLSAALAEEAAEFLPLPTASEWVESLITDAEYPIL